jgi:hypothetical protein
LQFGKFGIAVTELEDMIFNHVHNEGLHTMNELGHYITYVSAVSVRVLLRTSIRHFEGIVPWNGMCVGM